MECVSQEKKIDEQNTSVATLESADMLLSTAGLVRNLQYPPLLNLMNLLEALFKIKKMRKNFIKTKILAFCSFSNTYRSTSADALLQKLNSNSYLISSHLENQDLFFSLPVLTLSAYLFSTRLEIIYVSEHGRLSCQYFGPASKSKKRVFMYKNVYFVLSKTLPLSETFSTRICSDIQLNRAKNNPNAGFPTSGYYRLSELGNDPRISVKAYETGQRANNNGIINYEFGLPTDYSNFSYPYAVPCVHFNEADDGDFNIAIPKFFENKFVEPVSIVLPPFPVDIPTFSNTGFSSAKNESNVIRKSNSLDQLEQPYKLSQNSKQATGRLKFYNDEREYGFIIMDDNTEIFVHKADLVSQNIDSRYLAQYKKYFEIFMEFDIHDYMGKNKMHRKAINITLLEMQPLSK